MTATRRRVFVTGKKAADLRALYDRSVVNRRLFQREAERLVREHDGEWVAVSDGEFLYAASLDDLIAEMRQRNLPPSAFVGSICSTTPPKIFPA